MTIDEAIRRLTPYAKGEEVTTKLEDLDAIQLGIEALKAIEKYRSHYRIILELPLLGETEE